MTPADIITTAAEAAGVTPGDITSHSRKTAVVNARTAAVYAMHLAGWSSTEIGNALGCTHASALHHIQRGTIAMQDRRFYPALHDLVTEVLKKLKSMQ
jgi:chromosomal replication initiation ATPase DnaA